MDKLSEIYKKRVSRRNFLAGAGAVGAASALAGCSSSTPVGSIPPSPTVPAYTDADILNFALNLEYLEAEFYLRAATGNGLATADIGTNPGAVTAGSAAQVAGLTTSQQQILNEIAYEEQQHVRFLRSALGPAAIARPAIDLSFFGPLAVAAGITGPTFNPFASFDAFLIGAFIFEDVGVTAYSGAGPLLTSAANLGYASGILAVEAYHAGYIRTAITGRAINSGSATYLNIANQVSTLRATLGGGNETPLTLPTSLTTPSSIVAASTSGAIGFSRSTSQVLHIVYGSPTANTTKGGFFPNGITSTFSTAA